MMLFRIILLISLSFYFIAPLSGQDPRQINEDQYLENIDYQRGVELYEKEQLKESKTFLQAAADTFFVKKQWSGYIAAISYLVIAHQEAKYFETGIQIGLEALDRLAKNAPQEKPYKIYGSTGVLYSRINPKESINMHNKELSLLKEVYVQDTVIDFSKAYNNLAEAYLNYQQYDEALDLYLKAEEVALKFPAEEVNDLLPYIYLNIGFVYSIMGNSYRALEYYRQSESIMEKTGTIDGTPGVRILQMIAREYTVNQEPRKAISYAKNILYRIQKNKLEGDAIKYRLLPYTYTILGSQYIQILEFDEANHYYQKILDIYNEAGIEDLRKMSTHSRIADAYTNNGQLDSARFHFDMADTLINTFDEHMLSSGSFISALRSHYDRKGAYWQKKQDFEKSEAAYRAMLKVGKELGGTAYTFYIDVYNNFAKSGQLDSAFHYNQQALIKACYTFENPDYNALPAIEDVRDRSLIYKILIARATFKEWVYDSYDDATREQWWKHSIADIDFADQLHSSNLKKTNVLRGSSKSLITASIPIYKKGMSLAYDLYSFNREAQWVEKAFYYAQRKKAQQLSLSILSSNAKDFADIPTKLLEKEADLLSNIQYYNGKLKKAQASNDSTAIAKYENQYLFGAERELQALIRKMEVEYPDYYASKYDFKSLSTKEVQEQLKDEELMVEYVFSDSMLYLITVDHNAPVKLQEVVLNDNILEQIQSLNALLQNSPMSRPATRQKFINLSHEVYRQFVKPVEEQLAGKKRLIIIGDGMTHYIPFEVLLASDQVLPFDELDYLIRNLEVSYHYSTNLFLNSRLYNSAEQDDLFAFAPVFDEDQQTSSSTSGDNSITFSDSSLRAYSGEGQFQPLPETENEVRSIVKSFESRGYTDNTIAIRKKADEQALKSNLERPFKFVHIASHSFANAKDDRFSGIACFNPNQNSAEYFRR
jgi:CHAT domain-containing protein/tetratricopeptide (TPR) repeat protein